MGRILKRAELKVSLSTRVSPIFTSFTFPSNLTGNLIGDSHFFFSQEPQLWERSIISLMGIEIVGQIDKINGKELSYNDFAERYLAKSQPVVISDLTEDWRVREDWVAENGLPNLNFFATHFGKSRVQVKSTPLPNVVAFA